MSRFNCNLFRGRPDGIAFLPTYGPRIAACTLLLMCVVFNASCGFLSQSAAGSNSNNPPQSLTVSGTFPEGFTNQAYNSVLTVSGGSSPYQFVVKSGSLPPGMSLNPATGSVSGTPTAAGSYLFQVGATDAPLPHHGSQNFAIAIASGQGGGGIRVTVSPSSANVLSNQTQAFTATVTGTDNSGVVWAASSGSISNSGVFTAPTVSAVTNVWVTATSKVDSTKQGVATVTVEPQNVQTLSITTSNLPDGRTGNAYDAAFAATGGTPPYSWSVSQGSVPQGLNLNQNDGELAGMPGTAGGYNFTIQATDATAQTAQKHFALNIAASGNFDGPAELPRVTVPSSLADTPAPGTMITVNVGGDLEAALKNAHCGDTIELQAGATFTGTFDFPAKSCDAAHWIIVRTSAPDSALPAEGQRVTPCYAGVTSLPGRPQYTCMNPQNVLAKIEYGQSADGPLTFRNGANHFRLIGLEITRSTGIKGAPALMSVESGGVADHIVVDRSWLHGTAQDETQLGVLLNGASYVALVDSYFTDFHCTAGTGTCTDAHAVGGGNGDHQGGPFKIEDNFLEASGEAVMFGGAEATQNPADIEIRRNHFFKPWQWMPGNPGFVGGAGGHPFVVKNHLELKNATRVLIEANILENNWGGFTQSGYALVLSPKNPITRTGRLVCPLCLVTDVTIRYIHIVHAGAGIVMATGISGHNGDGGIALAGARYSIHDVVLDDISRNYVGGGTLFELANRWPQNPLNTVTINHITGFPADNSHLLTLGDHTPNPPMYGFVFTNNIVTTGQYPVWSTGGGSTACAYLGTPRTKISNCFSTNTFSNNALIASPQADPPSSWPAGNFFPQSANDAHFVGYNNGAGGNYELRADSPFKNAGTDGRDLGADIVGLQAALAGVE